AFNSNLLDATARERLKPLGDALRHPALAQSSFFIIGHTDGKGRAKYNQALSARRAAAVRKYLIATFSIEPIRLRAEGRGQAELKNAKDPSAPENRRVQVINAGVVPAASKSRAKPTGQ
ncbi:MAG: OmpA family protein, partial [Proteobacteria bacterium]|nr:OmpA family protein [Pseudomonadota bacterium]